MWIHIPVYPVKFTIHFSLLNASIYFDPFIADVAFTRCFETTQKVPLWRVIPHFYCATEKKKDVTDKKFKIEIFIYSASLKDTIHITKRKFFKNQFFISFLKFYFSVTPTVTMMKLFILKAFSWNLSNCSYAVFSIARQWYFRYFR